MKVKKSSKNIKYSVIVLLIFQVDKRFFRCSTFHEQRSKTLAVFHLIIFSLSRFFLKVPVIYHFYKIVNGSNRVEKFNSVTLTVKLFK